MRSSQPGRAHAHAPAQECTICGCDCAAAPPLLGVWKSLGVPKSIPWHRPTRHITSECAGTPPPRPVWPRTRNTGWSWHRGFPLDGLRLPAAASEVLLPSKPQPSPGPRGPSLGENHRVVRKLQGVWVKGKEIPSRPSPSAPQTDPPSILSVFHKNLKQSF